MEQNPINVAVKKGAAFYETRRFITVFTETAAAITTLYNLGYNRSQIVKVFPADSTT
jgi:hypothetical protein